MKALIPLALFLAAACTPRDMPPRDSQDFRFVVTDSRDEQRYELKLSAGASAICIGSDNWPNRFGQVHMGSLTAAVVAGDRRLPARDHNFGYCVGPGCEIRVEAGRHIDGFIPYAEFPGHADVVDSPERRLEFALRPQEC